MRVCACVRACVFYVHGDDDGERAPGAGNPMFSHKPGVVFGSQKTLELRCMRYTFIGVLLLFLPLFCSSDLWFLFYAAFVSLCAFEPFAGLTICVYWMDICGRRRRCRVRYFALSISRKNLFVNVSNDNDSSVRPLVWRHAIAKGHFICGAQTVKMYTYVFICILYMHVYMWHRHSRVHLPAAPICVCMCAMFSCCFLFADGSSIDERFKHFLLLLLLLVVVGYFELGTKSTTEQKLFIFMFSLQKVRSICQYWFQYWIFIVSFNYCVNLFARKKILRQEIFIWKFFKVVSIKFAVFKGEMYTQDKLWSRCNK